MAIFPVTYVVPTREQRAEEENDVIIPYDWEPFRTGRSLAPQGDLYGSWSFSTISRLTRIEKRPSAASSDARQEGVGGGNRTLAVLGLLEMKTTLRSHDSRKSGIARKDEARR